MSRNGVSLLTISSLAALSKVCSSHSSYDSIKTLRLLKNISTATERLDFQNLSGCSIENTSNYDLNPSECCTENWRNSIDFQQIPNGQGLNHGGFRDSPRSNCGNNPIGRNGNFSGLYGQNNDYLHQNTIGNYHNGVYRESSRYEYQNNIGGQDEKYIGHYVQNNEFFKENSRGFKQNSNQYHQKNGGIYGESTEYQNNTFRLSGNFSGYDCISSGQPQQNLNGTQPQMSWGWQHNLNSFYGGNASMQNNNGCIQEGLGEVRQNLNRFNAQSWSETQGSMNGSFMQNAGQYQQNPSDSVYQQNQNAGQYWWDQSLGNYQQNPNVGKCLPKSNDILNGTAASQAATNPTPEGQPAEASENSQNIVTLEKLDSFVKEGKVTEAVEVLGLLEKQCVFVALPRFLQLMQACGEAKALQEAKVVHEHVERLLSPLKVSTYNRILKMYIECGSVDDAFDTFNNMGERNLTSWDAMITGLAKNGLGEDAIDLFSQFKQAGLKPDGQMFIGVFSACSVLGDIIEGMLHFESMIKDYCIAPSMKHYVSIVEMLGSTCYLDEALEFIEKMPMEPSVDVWERLMNLCRIHGNLELGDRCAEFVEQLDPSRLNEKSKVGLVPVEASDLAKEQEKKKLASQNLLQVRSRVHEYRAGDTSHPETDKIYAQIIGLKAQMKEAGYMPETRFVLHDIDQESKEEALLAHSERLAVSHGLLNNPARAPIRIIKNLRVCGDCHTALKIISNIVGRELIIRDAKRFHHFKDGLCSCKDYW